MNRAIPRLVTIVALLAFLNGCASVTRENYARIQPGMTMDEVVKILGEPDDLEIVGIGPLEASSATWVGREGTIRVRFAAGKVLIRQFQRKDGSAGHD